MSKDNGFPVMLKLTIETNSRGFMDLFGHTVEGKSFELTSSISQREYEFAMAKETPGNSRSEIVFFTQFIA